MQSEELKPCPFCGSSDVHLRHHQADQMSWVSCVGCGLEAPSETGVTDDEAVSYWNRRAETALSTDAEPVEWQRRAGDYGWQRVNDEDLPHYREKGAELRALYDRPQQPAPSVAVKALEDIVERSNNGELGTSKVIDMRNIALSALSAQVQDVAEVSPAEYMRRHDAAIAAYEANTPSDYRYSALALRKAVDAAFEVAAAPAAKQGEAE